MDLIKKSAKTASAKLQFCRLAFGAAGSAGAQIDTGDAEKVARGLIEDEKTKLAWNLPRVLLAKNRVKLLLNMMLIAGQAIPRGGQLTVDPVGEGDTMGFQVTATGTNAKVPQAMPAAAGRRLRPSIRSTPMRSSRSTPACWPRTAGSASPWRSKATRWWSPRASRRSATPISAVNESLTRRVNAPLTAIGCDRARNRN